MAKFKVLMSDSIFPDLTVQRDELKKIDAELVLARDAAAQTLIDEGKECDAIMNVYAQLPAEVIDKLGKCKVIVRMGIGVNTIDIAAANAKKIKVVNVPDYCLDEVADHTIALMLSGIRKISNLNTQVKIGVWDVNMAKPIPRLQGLKCGLYGFGNIAQKVAKRAMAFDMEIWAFDPFLPEEAFSKAGVKRITDFDEFISNIDVLSLHVPLTKETEHIININTLKKMKKSAYIVNTSRGPLINENDLLCALESGIIAGACLDVLNEEPPVSPEKLRKYENLTITPHAAFYSEASMPELQKRATAEVVRVLKGEQPIHWVNKLALNC